MHPIKQLSSRFVGRRIIGFIAMVICAVVIIYWSHRYFQFLDYNPSLSNEIPAGSLPIGVSTFFTADQCPNGWQEVQDAQGRLVLSVKEKKWVGKTVGSPLEDQEDRPHRHHFMLTTSLPAKGVAANACCNWEGAESGFYRSDVYGSSGKSQLPFYQALFCQMLEDTTTETSNHQEKSGTTKGNTNGNKEPKGKTEKQDKKKEDKKTVQASNQKNEKPKGADHVLESLTWKAPQLPPGILSRVLPKGSISYFKGSQCPKGWVKHQGSDQRFILPLPSGGKPGAMVGDAYQPKKSLMLPSHLHDLSLAIDTYELGFVATKGDRQLAAHGHYEFKIDQQPVETNLPYIAMLACQSEKRERLHLPRGMTIFLKRQECPSGWVNLEESHGRFMVARPEGATENVAFGADALEPEELRSHDHVFRGNLHIKPRAAAVTSGCCYDGFAAATTYSYKGQTGASTLQYPYMQLLQCTLK